MRPPIPHDTAARHHPAGRTAAVRGARGMTHPDDETPGADTPGVSGATATTAQQRAHDIVAGLPPSLPPDCPHPPGARLLLRVRCAGGQIQYRRYCATCWDDLAGAISHLAARAELGDVDVPEVDIGQIHAARERWRAAR